MTSDRENDKGTADLRDRLWLEWLADRDPFSAAYLSCDSTHHALRLAHGLRAEWASLSAVIAPDDRLVGRIPSGRGVGGYANGMFCNKTRAEELKKESPEWRNHMEALVEFWREWEPGARVHLPPDEDFMAGLNVYWAGWGGHSILGFEQVLAEGTEGLRQSVSRFQQGETDPAKLAFREALLVVCDGIDAFARIYGSAAEDLAADTADANRAAQLRTISERCARVPRSGARDFAEALQSFWFIHLLDGADSPGRFDQYLLPYYEADISGGRLTRAEAQDWMVHLWERFNDTRSWNLCVGGLRPDGSDATNDLTYMALEATRRVRKVAPNLSLRLHRDSPPSLWLKAVEVIAIGGGMPALYNDEVLIPALMRYGIPEDEARDYALNGCSQVDIQGRSHMGLEDGEMNLLKCLELALHDGFDPLQHRQLGPQTGDPRNFTDFEQLWQAYTAQVEFFTERMIQRANAWQQAFAETSPALFRSLFVKDCIEKGIDFRSGGPRYNCGQILTQGIANTADSLAAIHTLVFEKRRVTMDDLLDALDADFPDEAFRAELAELPKYGNDDDSVDVLAARVVEHFYRLLNTYRTWRGGTYGGGAIVFSRAIPFGSRVGATPDGRKSRAPLADSVGPAQGRDSRGPTALLRSVAKAPQILSQSAYVLNIKFTPRIFRDGGDKIIALLQAYFALGGQQVQVNVVDRDTLIHAKESPDQYQGLMVRVGGYSDYFTRLPRDLQEEVISRTEHF